jgi:hypothetical protein
MEKKIAWMVLATICIMSSVVLALDPMGPPKADLLKGQLSVGAEYAQGEMDILRKTASWSDAKQTVNGKFDKIFANIGYGLSENVVGFIRLGAGQIDFDREADWTKWNGDGNYDFVWGGGFKSTLTESESIAWGILGQFSSGEYTGDATSTDDGEKAEYEVQMYEIQLAIGPTFKISDCFQIYGGPFAHLVSGDYTDIKEEDELEKPLEEKNNFGGYIGTCIKLAENTSFNVEYQDTGDAWAFAGGITFRF